MPLYVKNKNKTAYSSLVTALVIGALVLGWFDLRPSFAQSTVNEIEQISLSASLFGKDNRIIKNGTYPVRFALYTVNRTTADPYPSNADAPLWEETQEVTVKGGMFRTFLGSVTPLPASLNFETGSFYVGIRIGTDSEMVPRKKLGSVPRAINSQFLQGRSIGTKQGDIPLLGKGGKVDIKNLPTGTGSKQLVLGNDSRLSDAHQQNTDIGTDSEVFNIGSGTALAGTNFDLTVSSATTAPALRYNGSTGAWQLSNDGTTFTDIGSGSSGPITLGTDTDGNYVESVASGNGITGGAAGSEGAILTLGIDLLDSADGTGSTSSNSGLEFGGAGSNELALLQGCSNGQGIAWNDTTNVWECTSFSAGLAGSGSTGYVTYWSGTSALGSEAYLHPVRGGTGLDASAASNGSLLIGNGSGFSLNTLAGGTGVSVTNGSGVITLGIDATTSGTTAVTSSNSGIEATASGIRLLGGCSNDQVLAWNSGSSVWVCSNKSGGTSDWTSTGSLTYLTDVNDDLVIGGTAVDEGFVFDVSAGTLSFEGSSANGFETAFGVINPTADNAINLPDVSGTVITSGNLTDITTVGTIASGTWNGSVIGTTYGGTGASSLNNLIALGTHTTGNYVASVGNGNGITGGAAGSEGGTLTLGIDLLDSADGTGSTSSNSGLEFQGAGSNELGLLQGCANNEVLSWNDSLNVWQCASVTGVGGIDGTGSANAVAYWTDSNTLTYESQLSVSRGGTGIGTYTIGDILYASGSSTLSALADVATGNVLISGGVGIAPSWGKVNLTTAVTGTLPVGNGGTGATSLTDLIALTTHTTGNYVQSITNGSGITGGNGGSEGAALTLALSALTSDWNQTGAFDISLNNASSELKILESAGATFFGIFDVADLSSADKTYTFPNANGTVITTGNLTDITTVGTVVAGTWNGTAIGAQYGGTGINTSASTGVPIISSGTWSVASQLGVAQGGTGATTLTSNGVLYGNGTSAVQATTAGTDAQLLVANGSGVPVFVSMSGDVTITNAGVTTIGANTVALTTDTTGNYVASVGNGNGITGGAAGSEGATLTLGLDLLDSADGTGGTSSNSGLEFQGAGSNELTLLQGCSNNDVLAWVDASNSWACTSVGGVGAGDITAVGDVTSGAAFDGTQGTQLIFNDVDGDGTLTIANLSAIRTWTLPDTTGTLITTGDTGTVTGTMIADNTIEEVDFEATNSPTNGYILSYDNTSGGFTWISNTGGSGSSKFTDSGTITYLTDTTDDLALGGSTASTAKFFFDVNTGNQIIFEGTSADANETTLVITNPTADQTVTFADASGTVILSGHTFSGDVTGTLGTGGTTALTIASDSVALGTDTTGNYVSSATSNGGLTLTGTEGGSLGILLPAATNALSSTTSSGSGLELTSSGLSLLQGCADNEVLSWDEAADVWKCNSVGGVGAGDITAVGNVTSGAAFDGTAGTELYFNDVDGDGTLTIANLSAARTYTLPDVSGTVATLNGGQTFTSATWNATTIAVAYGGTGATTLTSNGVLYGNGTSAVQVTTAGTDAQLLVANGSGVPVFVSMSGDVTITNAGVTTIGANTVALTTDTTGNYVATITAGSGIAGTVASEGSTPTLDIDLLDSADGTGGTSSNSGLEFQGSGSDELTLLQGCSSNQLLLWNDTTNVWYCGSVSGAGGIDGSGSTGQVAYFTDADTLASEAQLSVSRGGTGIGTYTIGDILYASGSSTLSALADVATGNVLISGGVGIAPSWGKVNLTTAVTGTLPVGNGGTGATSLTDLIALTTHTTGNYVQSITNGSGITGGNGGSEGAALTLALSALTSDWNQTGAFDISLNNASSELKILESAGATFFGILDAGDLSADRTLTLPNVSGTLATIDGGQTFTSATWNASTVAVAYGGTGATTLTPNGVLYGNGTGAVQATSVGTDGQLFLGVSSSAPVFATMSGDATISNSGTLTISGNAVALGTDTTGNYVSSATSNGGLTLTGTEGASLGILLPSATDALSSTTSSGSGLELLASGLTLLQGCANNEVLSWNETSDVWACSSVSGVGGVTGSGATNQVAYWTGTSVLAGENQLNVSRGGTGLSGASAANGTLLIGNGSGYTLATLASSGSSIVITNGSGSINLESSLGTSVALTSEVTGTLPVGNGGTGATTFTTNGILYGNTTGALQVTAAGTSAQFLVANGTGVPTFVSMSSDATLANTGAITIAADAVALSTDTTGNYVATITNGSGISGSSSTEGGTPTIALGALTSDWNQTGAFDISLNNASSELKILESAGATFFGILDAGDLSADRTLTIPDASGTIALTSDLHSAVTLSGENYLSLAGQVITANAVNLSGTNVTGTLAAARFGTLTGDVTTAGGSYATTIAADAVALGTDTTGNYVSSATSNGGLTLTGTEGGSLGILLPSATDALSATTSSGSGLELLSAGLTLLQGCANDQVLAWNETADTWACSDKTGGTSNFTDSGTVTYLTSTTDDFALGGTGVDVSSFFFDVSAGTIQFEGTSADANETTLVITNPTADQTVTFADASGTVILSGHTFSGDVTSTLGTGGTTALTIASDSVALTTDTTGNYVQSITNGSGITGGNGGSEGAALTLALSALTSDWNQTGAFDISLNNASSELKILESAGATFFGILDAGDLSADRTLIIPDASGTILVSGGTLLTLAGTSGSSQTISQGDTITIAAGTGITTTGGATDTVTIASTLGTAIDGSEITDNTIEEVDLEVTNSPVGGYVLTYDAGTAGFTWVDGGGLGNSKFTDSGTFTYLTNTGDDFGLGGSTLTSARYVFDVSTTGNTIYFEGTGADDASETALVVTNPSADRTITLPDASGTVLLSGGTLLTLAGTSGSSQTISQGDTITIAAGTGITTTGGATDTVTIASTLGTAIDTSEVTDGTILEADLSATNAPVDTYILSYDNATGGFTWISNTGGTGASKFTDAGTVTYLTSTTDDLALGGSGSNASKFFFDVNTGNQIIFEGTGADDANETTLVITNPTADRTLTLPNLTGTIATIDGAQTFTSATWNGTAIGAPYGGTGLNTSASTGVPTISSGTWSVSAQLSALRGGTGVDGSAAANGTLLIGNGSGYTLATLASSGSSIVITNGSGSINLESSLGTTIEGSEITNDTVVLSTDTAGNYVQSITNGSGITGGNGGSEGAALTLALSALTSDWNQTGAFDISLNNASSELKILESAGATFFGILDAGDLTADRTLTIPDASGTILVSGGTLLTLAGTSGSNQTISQGDTITIAAGTGITTTGGATDTVTIASTLGTAIDTSEITDGTITGTDIADDNLDFIDFEDTLDLDAALVLNQSSNTWSQSYTGTTSNGFAYTANSLTTGSALSLTAASSPTGASSTSNGVAFNLTQSAATNATTYTGVNLAFTNNPSVAGNTEYAFQIQNQATTNTTDNAVAALLRLDNADTTATGTTVVTDAILITNSGGSDFTNFLNTPTLDISAAGAITGATGITSSGTITFSGFTTNGGLLYTNGSGVLSQTGAGTSSGLLHGGTTPTYGDVILGTETSGNYVATLTSGNGISATATGEGSTPTIALSALTADWNQTGAFDISLNNASSELKILESAGATFFGIFDVTDLSSDRTYTFPNVSGTVATIDGGQTFTSATWNGTAIGAQYGGTGLNTSASTGVPTISSGTWSVASSLGIALGGTNATSIGSAGSIAYSTGTAYAFSAVGTAGQALVSGGTGAPTFFAPTAGSVVFAGTSGILQQDNASFFFDDTNNRLGLGTTSPAAQLSILGTSNALRLSYDVSNYASLSTASDGTLSLTSSNTSESQFVIGTGASVDDSVGFDGASVDYYAGLDHTTGYFTIGTGFTVGSSTLFAIDSTGNIGIGTGVTAPAARLDLSLSSTNTTAGTEYGQRNTVSDTGVVTAGTDTTYGTYNTLSRSGATGGTISDVALYNGLTSTLVVAGTEYGIQNVISDTGVVTTGTDTTYGTSTTVTRTGATGGTINTYGLNMTVTTDNAGSGTSTAYGLNIDTGTSGSTNADTVYGLKIATEANTSTTAYGLYVDAGTQAGTEYAAAFLNGNVGIGTATPTTLFELYGTGSADAIATITAPDTTYDPAMKFRTGSSPAVQFTLGVDNSDSDKFKIYSGDGLGSGDEFVIDSNGVTTIANLNLGATNFDTDAGIISWVDMAVTASSPAATVESYSAAVDGTSFLTIYAESDGSGGLTTTASAVKSDVQLDATADGLVTKVNAGACSDSTFNRDTNGTLCVDSTNGRIYYRYSGAWHYTAQTAGFQIPNYETAPQNKLTRDAKDEQENALAFDSSNYPEYLTDRMKPGEFLVPYVDEYLPDGAVHGLYARFSDVKAKMFGEEQSQIAQLTLQTNANVNTLAELQVSVDDQLVVVGNSLNALSTKDAEVDAKLATYDTYFANDLAHLETLDTVTSALNLGLSEQVAKTTLLESQVTTLTDQVSTLLEFYTTFDMGSLVSADTEGNVSLAGKLKAKIVESEGLVIEVVDPLAPTIGTAEILPPAVDADNDGNDDYTGQPMTDADVIARDGKFVKVMTKAMIPMVKGSRIFTTFKDNPSGFSWIEKVRDEDGDYVGFKIHLSQPITDKVKVDWLLIEQKETNLP